MSVLSNQPYDGGLSPSATVMEDKQRQRSSPCPTNKPQPYEGGLSPSAIKTSKILTFGQFCEYTFSTCRSGGIGRRARLKIVYPRGCGFDSHLRHQKSPPIGRAFDFLIAQVCAYLVFLSICGNVVLAATLLYSTAWILARLPVGVRKHLPASLASARRS